MTNSNSGVLLGAQEPRYRPSIRKRSPHADDCAFLATAYDLKPDPWQDLVVNCWLAIDPTGKLKHGRCGLAVPRQNGKNAILEMVELYKMVVQGRKILHTAHEVKTARKAFLRLSGFFENDRRWPELARMVKEIRRTNGQEAIILHKAACPSLKDGECDCPRDGGGSCEFIARSRGSGRGFTVDDLVCDEAQELTDEQLEALLPTISSAPSGDPQQIYTGTPPSPGSPGTVFRRMRDAGITRKDPRLAWLEWSVAEIGDIFDRHRVAATNPALGVRLQMSVIDDELGQMTPEGYARERLGWWAQSGPAAKPKIDETVWTARSTAAPLTVGRIAVGVKFDHGMVAAAACRYNPDSERAHCEVLGEWDETTGIDVLGAFLGSQWRQLASIVIDGRSGAGTLAERLSKLPRSVVRLPTVPEVQTAHTMTLTAIETGKVTHANQPGLNGAVKVATQRKIGKLGGWGWEAIGDGDVLPLDAMTFALWGATTSKRNPDGASNSWRVVTG